LLQPLVEQEKGDTEMALTYEQSAALMNDAAFRGRIKVCVLHFANYIFDEAPNALAHNTKFKWAQNAIVQPDMVATQVQPVVVMDAAVQGSGSSIDDATLQSATENALLKLL
jgi:hypothetical protein